MPSRRAPQFPHPKRVPVHSTMRRDLREKLNQVPDKRGLVSTVLDHFLPYYVDNGHNLHALLDERDRKAHIRRDLDLEIKALDDVITSHLREDSDQRLRDAAKPAATPEHPVIVDGRRVLLERLKSGRFDEDQHRGWLDGWLLQCRAAHLEVKDTEALTKLMFPDGPPKELVGKRSSK